MLKNCDGDILSTTLSTLSYPAQFVAEGSASRSHQEKLLRMCKLQLVFSILISRLGVPLGAKQVQMTWIVGILFFVAIAFKTRFAVSKPRLVAFTCIGIAIAFESAYFQYSFSPLSIVFLLGIYGPLCLALPSLDAEHLRQMWRTFVQLVTIIAICGLLQVAVELVTHYFVDPLGLLPQQFQLEGYMTLYQTTIGPLTYIKPNGMFTLEPSFFSQFMALGLIGEMQFFKRPKVILLLLAALLISFSGTGLLVLVSALPFVKQAPKWIALLFVIGLAWNIGVGGRAGNFYSKRMAEINEPGQSGNARFVAPYEEMWDRWQHSTKELLAGSGAGSSSNLGALFEANFAPVAKVGFEFGLIGVIVFFPFWLQMYFHLALPGALVMALWTFYFVACGALLHPPTVFPIWALTLGFMSKREAIR